MIGSTQPRRQMFQMNRPADDDRDDDEQLERRELGLHVGVARALDHPARRERELEAAEVVLRRLHQRHQGEDHREVRLHLRGDPLERALEADPAVEVVLDGGDDEHDHEPGEEPLEDELDERQLEDVEADVLVELRVLHAEVGGVGEEHPLLPLRRHADAGDEREEDRDTDADAAREAPGGLAVAGDELVLGPHRAVLGRDAGRR